MMKINFFRTLKLRLAIIQWVFIQEKQLKLDKKSKFCGILICPQHISSSQASNSLENQKFTMIVTVKPLSLATLERAKWVWNLAPKAQRILLLDLFNSKLKSTILQICLYLAWCRGHSVQIDLSPGHLLKIINKFNAN